MSEKGDGPGPRFPVADLIDHGGFPFADQRQDFASWCDWARYRARQCQYEYRPRASKDPTLASGSRARGVPVDVLRLLLDYDPATGDFAWRARSADQFKATTKLSAEGQASRWNAKYAGKAAFTTLTHGYRTGRINRVGVQAHRVAWAITFGAWPEIIDHIDGNRSNNRLSNLRDVTAFGNAQNMECHRAGLACGVRKVKRRFEAYYFLAGKRVGLGWFDTAEEASAHRETAAPARVNGNGETNGGDQ